MRVAALYDIHGNDAALAAVLAEIEALGVELIVVGGDVAGGPFPCETVDAVRALGDRAITIRGNGERELVEARLRLDAGTRAHRRRRHLVVAHALGRGAARLRSDSTGWAPCRRSSSVEIDGLGDVLFCHGSPRSDEEIVTPLSPAERIAPILAGVSQRTVVLRPHARAVRPRASGRAGSSTPAASACRTRAMRRRSGPCSARTSSCAARATTSRRCCARVRASGHPATPRSTPTGSRARPAPPRRASSSSAWRRAPRV